MIFWGLILILKKNSPQYKAEKEKIRGSRESVGSGAAVRGQHGLSPAGGGENGQTHDVSVSV